VTRRSPCALETQSIKQLRYFVAIAAGRAFIEALREFMAARRDDG
jgi:hypothetical protein